MTSMTKRSGPFWDAMEGRAPMPRAAATLGLRFLAADPDAGAMEVEFNATDAFTNPTGNVLGAFLAAMLYDTIGPTLLATLNADQFQSTLDLNVRFIRPARPGRIIGRGRIVRRDGDIALVEASLVDPEAETIAVATATAKVIPLANAVNAV